MPQMNNLDHLVDCFCLVNKTMAIEVIRLYFLYFQSSVQIVDTLIGFACVSLTVGMFCDFLWICVL